MAHLGSADMTALLRLIPAPYLAVGLLIAAGALYGAGYIQGRSAGRDAVLARLKDDRITIFQDGKRIDEEVLNADDGALCSLLGGCELPDE
jgi:hypothetical protein